MITRISRCGHPYETTARGGRPRLLCDDCLLAAPDTPSNVELRRQRFGDGTTKKCQSCGIFVQRHTYCDDCLLAAPDTSANRQALARRFGTPTGIIRCPCGTFVMDASIQQKFCSKRCGEVQRGQRLPASLPERTCALEECQERFIPWARYQRCCSEKHGKLLYNRESRADGRQPHPGWTDARRDAWHRRRAIQLGASTGRPVLRDEIAARDGYVCGICGETVEMTTKWPDPMSPSLDHVRPLQPRDGSEPGLHDPDNVQLAHLSCNVRKNNLVLPAL